MAPYATACCASLLNQRQQIKILYYNRSQGDSDSKLHQQYNLEKPQYCTVIENGRVVVKPKP
jgi:hypothetical protein